MIREIWFTVNGKAIAVACPETKTLLDVLREDLSLTGAKECCGKGECGSCSVLLDGDVVCACLVLAGQVEGSEVRTVEAQWDSAADDAIYQAFVAEGATQCGYCTPGIVVAARAYLATVTTVPSRAEIATALAGNLCRCTGYQKIIAAVDHAARQMFAAKEGVS